MWKECDLRIGEGGPKQENNLVQNRAAQSKSREKVGIFAITHFLCRPALDSPHAHNWRASFFRDERPHTGTIIQS